MNSPCDQCPWRKSNHGQRHKMGFYTKGNLTRLWGQIRRAKWGTAQSCHLTDPSHPDHVESGAPEGAKAKECPGSVILVLREFLLMANGGNKIDAVEIERYLETRKKGLTKKGILYWLVSRYQFGGVTFFGANKLPEVDMHDEEIGLPDYLQG